jgi:hypothetical protein
MPGAGHQQCFVLPLASQIRRHGRVDDGGDDALEVTGWSYSYLGSNDVYMEGGTGNDTLSVSELRSAK